MDPRTKRSRGEDTDNSEISDTRSASPHSRLHPIPFQGAPDTRIVHFRLLVAAEKAGAVIGKGGQHINTIKAATGARVHIDPQRRGCAERVVHIEAADAPGAPRCPAQEALLLAFDRASGDELPGGRVQAPEAAAARLLLPKSEVGGVLGPRGAGVAGVRRESCAVVRIEGGVGGVPLALPDDELVTVQGAFPAVRLAVDLISARIRAIPPAELAAAEERVKRQRAAAAAGRPARQPPPPLPPRGGRPMVAAGGGGGYGSSGGYSSGGGGGDSDQWLGAADPFHANGRDPAAFGGMGYSPSDSGAGGGGGPTGFNPGAPNFNGGLGGPGGAGGCPAALSALPPALRGVLADNPSIEGLGRLAGAAAVEYRLLVPSRKSGVVIGHHGAVRMARTCARTARRSAHRGRPGLLDGRSGRASETNSLRQHPPERTSTHTSWRPHPRAQVIRAVRDAFGARVDFPEAAAGAQERILQIMSTEDVRDARCDALKAAAHCADLLLHDRGRGRDDDALRGRSRLRMLLTKGLVGAVMGRKGATIQALRAAARADIDIIARPGDRAGAPPPPGARAGDEVLQITGALQDVLDAARVVMLAVRGNMARAQLEFRHAPPPGAPPPANRRLAAAQQLADGGGYGGAGGAAPCAPARPMLQPRYELQQQAYVAVLYPPAAQQQPRIQAAHYGAEAAAWAPPAYQAAPAGSQLAAPPAAAPAGYEAFGAAAAGDQLQPGFAHQHQHQQQQQPPAAAAMVGGSMAAGVGGGGAAGLAGAAAPAQPAAAAAADPEALAGTRLLLAPSQAAAITHDKLAQVRALTGVSAQPAGLDGAGQHCLDMTGSRRQVDAAISVVSLIVNMAAAG
ncbi:MAG: hypothetical protein J3K34DRAFT_459469 [Monoraphidium minutum]|nr:MAG: hypothetical protein J3K34DRAFT_459469 [Monoraphidium minutum]